MTTWAKNPSEFLSFLNGFDSRDAFSKSLRFPVVRLPNANAEKEKPPMEAQNDVLALVYKILGILRKEKKRPSARDLLSVPQVDELFSKATQPMVEAANSVDQPLQKAIERLVTEAYIEQIRNEFVGELARSLKAFRVRLAKERAKRDDWREELDSGVVLYDVFRPNLWDLYRDLWNKWQADMVCIRGLATRVQRIDETLKEEEVDS